METDAMEKRIETLVRQGAPFLAPDEVDDLIGQVRAGEPGIALTVLVTGSPLWRFPRHWLQEALACAVEMGVDEDVIAMLDARLNSQPNGKRD